MLNRRNLFLGVGSSLISKTAAADINCQDYYGFRRCEVGIIIPYFTARQEKTNWCWAACIETVFQIHGRSVDQGVIARKVFGEEIDIPASGPQIAYAISGEWIDDRGNTFFANASVLWDSQYSFKRPDAIMQAANQLQIGNPLIIGALGHATLLTAMTYSSNGINVNIENMIVRDPWPGNPNRRVFTPQEAWNTQFLAQVDVS